MKPYPIQLEISGPSALWARPDTLPNPVSYVAPTFSAVKCIFGGSAGDSPASVGDSPNDSSVRWKSVNVRLSACDAQAGPARCGRRCLHPPAPVQFHRYAFNYGGPLRKSGQVKDGASCSLAHRMGEGGRRPGEGGLCAQALINVCYRLHAEVDWNRGPNGEPAESPDGQCAPHALSLARRTGEGVRRTGEGRHCFQRRLERVRWFYTPCLGNCPSPAPYAGEGGRRPGEGRRWHKCLTTSTSAVPDYVGPFRDGTAPCATENHVIPAFREMVFDQPQNVMN